MNNEKVAWCVKNEKGLMLECLHEQKMFCEIDKEILDRTQHTKHEIVNVVIKIQVTEVGHE